MRPALSPARRLWRDRETLQLGAPPGRAVVLAGVDDAARGLLALLDGTRDRSTLLQAAMAAGCPAAQAEEVLNLLESAGLLEDADLVRAPLNALPPADRDRLAAELGALRLSREDDPLTVLRRRRTARVVVDGAGRVGVALAGALADAGVGHVNVVDEGIARAEDCGAGGLPLAAVGRPRGQAAAELLRAHRAPGAERAPGADRAPAADRAPGRSGGRYALPDLVVLAPPSGLPMPVPPPLVPHLAVLAAGNVGVVGPLVQPGQSACLGCLDLARADRDPGWPALAVQLDRPAPGVAPCGGALALAVAAQAALQALALLDGGTPAATLGGTLELALPDWRWRRRSWQLHPDCGCG